MHSGMGFVKYFDGQTTLNLFMDFDLLLFKKEDTDILKVNSYLTQKSLN